MAHCQQSGLYQTHLQYLPHSVTPASYVCMSCMVLMQPTNDLDLATVESMESFLAGYGGCLLVASHDRAFMEGLDRLFVLRGDGVVRLFEGSYSEVQPFL